MHAPNKSFLCIKEFYKPDSHLVCKNKCPSLSVIDCKINFGCCNFLSSLISDVVNSGIRCDFTNASAFSGLFKQK